LSWRPPVTKLCAGAGADASATAVMPSFCTHMRLAVILGYHGCICRGGSQLLQAGERVRAEWFPAHRTRAAECSPVVFVCPMLLVLRGCMHPPIVVLVLWTVIMPVIIMQCSSLAATTAAVIDGRLYPSACVDIFVQPYVTSCVCANVAMSPLGYMAFGRVASSTWAF
jgi:hypothetical protein